MVLDEVLTITEAATLWDKDLSTVRKACIAGRFGNESRKSGATWLVTKKGMIKLYGDIKKDQAD